MSFESIGQGLGGAIGGVGGAAGGAVIGGGIGFGKGAAEGGLVGAGVGLVAPPAEPVTTGLGAITGGTIEGTMGAVAGGTAGAIAGAKAGSSLGGAIGRWLDHMVTQMQGADDKAGEHPDQPTDGCAGQCNPPAQTPPFTDVPGKVPFKGKPGSTVRGPKQSRTYGSDGYPQTDRDEPHQSESGIGNGDHSQDWGRPADGSPPTSDDRGPPRLPQPGDPPPPRGFGTPQS